MTIIITLLLLLLSSLAASAVDFRAAGQTWQNVVVGSQAVSVNSILQDERGMMWLGTDGGFYNYDGYRMRRFPHPDLKFNPVVFDMLDYDGKIYVATSGGLLVFDYWVERYLPLDVETPQSIHAVARQGDDLWLGSDYGLYRLNLKENKIYNLTAGLPHTAVKALYSDDRGNLYVATYDGLVTYNQLTDKYRLINLSSTPNSRISVLDIYPEYNGKKLWIATDKGVFKYDPTTGNAEQVEQLNAGFINALAISPTGRLLAGTHNGLLVYDGQNVTVMRHDSRHPNSLGNNVVNTLLVDNQGNIWAGTDTGFSITVADLPVVEHPLSDFTGRGDGNQIHVMLRDSRGDFWLGGTNGTIRMLANGNISWHTSGEHNNELVNNRIRDIFESDDGQIWIAGDGGLYHYEPHGDHGRFVRYEIVDSTSRHSTLRVDNIGEDRRHNLWIAANMAGIFSVEHKSLPLDGGRSFATRHLCGETDFAHRPVEEMIVDRRGNKWVILQRDSSLTRIDAISGAVTKIPIQQSLGDFPSALIEDNDGHIWVGTRNGLAILNYNGSNIATVSFPLSMPQEEGLLAMGAVGNSIWVSTAAGLWAIDCRDRQFRLLPVPERAYSSIYFDEVSGRVALGGINLLTFVDPARMNSPRTDSLHIVGVTVGNTPLELPLCELNKLKNISLSYDNPSVAIALSTFDYTPGYSVRYFYTIDDQEVPVVLPEGSNIISLMNLPVGKHKLKINIVGSSRQPKELIINVTPPWFLRWWFILFVVLLLAALFFGVRLALRRHKQRNEKDRRRDESLRQAVDHMAFLSNMSHELKTPLSMIVGPVSKMREETSDDKLRSQLDMVYTNAMKLRQLVNDSIELNRADASTEDPLLLSHVNLSRFLSVTLKAYRGAYTEKSFSLNLPDEELTVVADPVKIESIVNNLINNACKYTPADGLISVSLSLDKESDRAKITVSDNGCGIPDDEQEQVFKRMYRAQNAHETAEGSGIGLYLVNKYVKMHGGTVNLESQPGKGSVFTVTIPITHPESTLAADKSHTPSPSSGRRRVLVVEDNSEISAFIKDLLDETYDVRTASDGRQGLQCVNEWKPDLIIVDEMMPVMNGLEMCRRLKSVNDLASIPLIMLSARDDIATQSEAARIGVNVFMAKPFDAPLLLMRVAQLLEMKRRDNAGAHLEKVAKADECESSTDRQLDRITEVIEKHLADPDLNVAFVAEKTGINAKQLYRILTRQYGMKPVDYIRRIRLAKAAMLLKRNSFSVAEVMYMVGFNSPSYFSKCFKAEFGCNPGQYSQNNADLS